MDIFTDDTLTCISSIKGTRVAILCKAYNGSTFFLTAKFTMQFKICKLVKSYPLTAPEGPIDVLNMRLNSIGSLSSLPVDGDFNSYFLMVSLICSLLMLSIC